MMHDGLVGVLRSILRDVGIPDMAVVTKVGGLWSVDATRPGDVVTLYFFAEGIHMVIDMVVTTVYRNTIYACEYADLWTAYDTDVPSRDIFRVGWGDS